MTMTLSPAPPSVMEAVPELARRLGLIVAGLAEVVARRFLRDPKFMWVIVPLWHWLHRSARRFARVTLRPAAPRRPRAARAGVGPRARVRLPQRKAWLVQALGYEAAGYGSQLAYLRAEPDMQAVLAAVPAAGRILRPSCWILCVTAPKLPARQDAPAPTPCEVAPLEVLLGPLLPADGVCGLARDTVCADVAPDISRKR